ncbi:hypothetical protein C4D60_Mb08t24190 [Musa balbisiana]|uniref:Uncharacterized protein n=1 Tax=Musa balbisiana TaxID=52838 RepID=A0A4S8K641_MUSBA|nr:hypothetical protein C4D60_Mb08t24190 [Musa balbisiana]
MAVVGPTVLFFLLGGAPRSRRTGQTAPVGSGANSNQTAASAGEGNGCQPPGSWFFCRFTLFPSFPTRLLNFTVFQDSVLPKVESKDNHQLQEKRVTNKEDAGELPAAVALLRFGFRVLRLGFGFGFSAALNWGDLRHQRIRHSSSSSASFVFLPCSCGGEKGMSGRSTEKAKK